MCKWTQPFWATGCQRSNRNQVSHFTIGDKKITRLTFRRQIWRVAGRESGSPELLGSPRTSPEVPRTSPEVFGDFPGSSLTVELNSKPEVPRKFPKLPRKFPKLPRKFRDFPGGQPLSLGSLTPSPGSPKVSLNFYSRRFILGNSFVCFVCAREVLGELLLNYPEN